MKKHYEDVEITLQEAIDRLHSELWKASRSRSIKKIKSYLFNMQELLIEVDEACVGDFANQTTVTVYEEVIDLNDEPGGRLHRGEQ